MAGAEQKEKILRYYRNTEGEEVAVRLVDMAEQVQRSQKFRLGEFLDPYGQEIAETIAANYPGLRLD
ncbi:MAG: RNA-binding protein, partial [Anaerovibrio sp.]|nr:RNA-binding protein [Anaerovibrio sp.]